jgi:hypothetical protein
MDNLMNPVLLDALLTAGICAAVLAVSGLTLWLLPWSDQSIRSIDKALNPLDLTAEDIPSLRLSRGAVLSR